MTTARLVLFGLLPVVLVGCGGHPDRPPLYPATGKVLFEGKPAVGAVVMFHATGDVAGASRPRGRADGTGAFELTTYENGDGAPAGTYVVTVEWRQAGDHPEQGAELLPAAYGNPTTSPLRVTLAPDRSELILLRLTRNPRLAQPRGE